MSLVFYVYFKVAPGAEHRARELARALIADVRRETGIAGTLLRRRDDPSTWMEVYQDVTDGSSFEALLKRLAEASGFQQVLKEGSGRRLEIFQAL